LEINLTTEEAGMSAARTLRDPKSSREKKASAATALTRRKRIQTKDERIAALEAAIVRMHRAVPGGRMCDPQAVADRLREIAASVGVDVGQ
jgi:hypothetical protein